MKALRTQKETRHCDQLRACTLKGRFFLRLRACFASPSLFGALLPAVVHAAQRPKSTAGSSARCTVHARRPRRGNEGSEDSRHPEMARPIKLGRALDTSWRVPPPGMLLFPRTECEKKGHSTESWPPPPRAVAHKWRWSPASPRAREKKNKERDAGCRRRVGRFIAGRWRCCQTLMRSTRRGLRRSGLPPPSLDP